MPDDTKSLILGDFNYIRYPHNMSKNVGNLTEIFTFSKAISQLTLIEIPLKGRKFTWSNMQEAPLLQKLD